MNLISDPWIKVISNGCNQLITPAEIVHPKYLDLCSDRPDFKGALYQFMIGLLQTCFAPQDEGDWERLWLQPPDSSTLLEAFSKYKSAFELISDDGPAFMQDFDLKTADQTDIAALLIDSPGDSTIKQGRDLFIKRDRIKGLCMPCAALALFTLQINAPSGGQGHRVGLRGGGPLTTLLVPVEEDASLWKKLWLNVVPLSKIEIFKKTIRNESKYIFPWLAPTAISDKGITILPEDMHPFHAYWSMPRRIRLKIENLEEGLCDLCGNETPEIISNYFTKNYGMNYDGAWMHPLSPYQVIKNSKEYTPPLSIKGQTGGFGYRHWLGLCLGTNSGKKDEYPAAVVSNYRSYLDNFDEENQGYLLWCFGYDMDNMKARCWYENKLPLFKIHSIKENSLDDIKDAIAQLLDTAYEMLKLIKKYLKQVWSEHAEGRVDFLFIDKIFWEDSEQDFYHCLKDILNQKNYYHIFNRWLTKMKKFSLAIFDQQTLAAPPEDLNLKKAITARNDLDKWLTYSKIIKDVWKKEVGAKKPSDIIKEPI